MSTTLSPSGFMETFDCTGLRYIRSQPSRETPGTTLNCCLNKYGQEFSYPTKNILELMLFLQKYYKACNDKDKEALIDILKALFFNDDTSFLLALFKDYYKPPSPTPADKTIEKKVKIKETLIQNPFFWATIVLAVIILIYVLPLLIPKH